VPIHLRSGEVYGTFCCFSTRPDLSLTVRDLALMRMFADLTAGALDRDLAQGREAQATRGRVQSVLDEDGLSMVYQPIKDIASGMTVGYEALARFTAAPARPPNLWFDEAARVGLGLALEARAIEKALAALPRLPPGAGLSCNVSPQLVLEGRVERLLAQAPCERLVLEITEHAVVSDYEALAVALEPLRARGARIAVDDAGAGYASFRHILALRPHVIKLDMSLTRDIDTHVGRRALAAALLRFSQETGSVLVAEGVETASELATLTTLGVTRAQGYLLGRPAPLPELPV
jgi:EAL domain-containing protein (putative c-di-GMP-specific phosphodiesterase class I)